MNLFLNTIIFSDWSSSGWNSKNSNNKSQSVIFNYISIPSTDLISSSRSMHFKGLGLFDKNLKSFVQVLSASILNDQKWLCKILNKFISIGQFFSLDLFRKPDEFIIVKSIESKNSNSYVLK